MTHFGANASGSDVEFKLTRPDRFPNDRTAVAFNQDLQPNEPSTIGAVVRAQAKLRPEQPAIIGNEFLPLSYGELQRQIDEVRVCLRDAGFDRNARIAVAIANSAEAAWIITAVACSAGAIPLDPKLTPAEVEKCLLILRPNAVIVLHDGSSAARQVAVQHGVPLISASRVERGKLGLRLAVPRIGSPCPMDDPDIDAPAFILHTSGTTAEPNLVPFSHRNTLASAKRVQFWFGLTPQDRCLNVSPVYYSHALTTTVLPPLLTGGSVAFPANPLNVDLSEWFGTLRPTWYSAGPTLHLGVLEKAQLRPDAPSMHCLRFISSAGAKIPKDARDDLERVLGVPILEHYGSSETAQISANMPPPGPCKPGTCGVPWPGIIKLVGDDEQEVAAGEHGEILVRGPGVMAGYLNSPALNHSVFIDGWYRTGDIGSIDDQGFLSLHARKRELINRGAEKISPVEIDHALMQHSDVVEAAAYAVPHVRLGEDVAAAVVLRPGSNVTPTQLREFLVERLAPFKIPRRIAIVDSLPKGTTGKVQRTRLRDVVSDRPAPPDAGLLAHFVQFWNRLKQLILLKTPRLASTGNESLGAITAPEAGVLSEARLQAELLQIWARLLKVEDLSIDDDFFDKGGNSLLAMDLYAEVERLTGKSPTESFLSEAATIRALAKSLSS